MTANSTILIIDDDPDDRNLFAEALLEADGSFTCVQADCGDEALDLLQNVNVRLPLFIFLDLNMPRMNGWQCLSLLRKMERLKAVPIIIYTTTKSDEDEERAKSAGAAYFLTKPARFKELVHAIFFVVNKKWHRVPESNDLGNKK